MLEMERTMNEKIISLKNVGKSFFVRTNIFGGKRELMGLSFSTSTSTSNPPE